MGEVRTVCDACGMKWFFDEFHQAQPDVDMTSCGNCGGRLRPLDDPARRHRPAV